MVLATGKETDVEDGGAWNPITPWKRRQICSSRGNGWQDEECWRVRAAPNTYYKIMDELSKEFATLKTVTRKISQTLEMEDYQAEKVHYFRGSNGEE